MAILVTGGAGYIGSHIVRALQEHNREAVVFDSREAPSQACATVRCFRGEVGVKADLQKAFQKHAIETVIHCAGSGLIEESMRVPERCYENNVSGTLNLLAAMNEAGVRQLVYTSSGAVYGEPERIPMDEEHQQIPASVYGHTKLCVEKMLGWFDAIYGMKSVVLRCCNAAGAHPSGELAQAQGEHTGLIPRAIQAALGKRDSVPLYGTDYATRDGSCVRDYVHVCDVAEAHARACDWLAAGKQPAVFNIGRGTGVSVREIIETVEKISGKKIALCEEPCRPGDTSIMIVNISAAKMNLGWQPRFRDIQEIVQTAWNWHSRG
jgi:UDP-glucose 4-epimerase